MRIVRGLGLACLLLPALAAAKLGIEVDRSPIEAQGEFQLILSLDKSTNEEPDLQALASLFPIEGSSQSHQTRVVNGQVSAQTQRVLSLRAGQPGIYHLPPLTWAGEQSEAMELRVVPVSETSLPDVTDTLFMKAELDQPEVLVGSQAILTLRVYYAEQIYNRAEFAKLVLDDALVEALGKERQYQKTLKGRRYGIIEKRYALFPQKTGELAIPAIRFVTEVGSAQRGRYALDVFNRTEEQELRSEPLMLMVKPAPAGAPQPWLPARALKLQAELSPDTGKGQAGEPLTWTLRIEADGLAAALLPSIQPAQIPGAKLYPDAPSLSQRLSDERLIGTRVEKLAVVPSAGGSLELPEVRVAWWDVQNQRQQVAVLPARRLEIAGAPATAPAPVAAPTQAPAAQARSTEPTTTPGFWPWLTALCATGWLATLALLLRRRGFIVTTTASTEDPDEAECWKQLLAAIEAGHSGQITQKLTRWAARRFPQQTWHTAQDWLRHFADPELERELQRLAATRYATQPGEAADRQILLQALRRIRGASADKTDHAAALALLYPRT